MEKKSLGNLSDSLPKMRNIQNLQKPGIDQKTIILHRPLAWREFSWSLGSIALFIRFDHSTSYAEWH